MGQNPQQVINTQIGDFNTNAKGEIENALVIVKAMLAGLLQMEQTNFDFKQTIASWPRVTSAINKARRHTVAVLEQLAVEVKTSINLLSEVKRLMSDLLEKNQGPLEAKPYRVL